MKNDIAYWVMMIGLLVVCVCMMITISIMIVHLAWVDAWRPLVCR